MQFADTAKPATAILYDSDFGRNIDSVLALALLHGFAGKTQARVSALTINYPCLQAAQLCDIVESFYRKPVTNPAAAYLAAPAIGLLEGAGKTVEEPALIKATLTQKGDADKPKWQSSVGHWNDTAVPEVLIRNNLAAQHDGNAVLVMTGTATNLSRLLALQETLPLISAKVKMLVVAGGRFTSGPSDQAFAADLAAAKRLLAEWPTAITLCGHEIGDQLLFPAKCIENDFSYAPAHPVVDAYRARGPMPYDAPTCALAAMLFAIRPGDGYFSVGKPGTVSLTNDGRTVFKESGDGKHSYLSAIPEKHDEIIQKFTEMVSAKPVFPAPRGRQKDAAQ
jgi:inosine-uridine nucleoside N-ribohydrolase